MDYIRKTEGYCTVCKQKTFFIAEQYWLRDYYKCENCTSIPRQRALRKVLRDIRPRYEELKIHESSPSKRLAKRVEEECKDYTYSFFYEDKPLGEELESGGINQNLENMTFDDDVFDVFITQDVFEHVLNPIKAFQEIERVLKPGGIHIFTVPIYLFTKTRPRVVFEGGELVNVLPAVYHGNPISKEGSLVTWDWGDDIAEVIDENCKSMKTEVIQFPHTEENYRLGLEADYLQVIVSHKIS